MSPVFIGYLTFGIGESQWEGQPAAPARRTRKSFRWNDRRGRRLRHARRRLREREWSSGSRTPGGPVGWV